MAANSAPKLPQGQVSLFGGLTQSLSFHSSPEDFIASRIQVLEQAHQTGPAVVRARILNRDVAIVSSHRLCEAVLQKEQDSQDPVITTRQGRIPHPHTFTAGSAYQQLMADFFPPPNLLLKDHDDHSVRRELWEKHLSSFPSDVTPTIRDLTSDHIDSWTNNSSIDLYDSLKTLSWRIILGIFLQLQPTDDLHQTVQSLQETLLRGQFSLLPLAFRTPFWHSPRAKGLEARQKLQGLLKNHFTAQSTECPFSRQGNVSKDDLATHCLLFTSSLAVKALASLLTATILNLFIMPCEPSLASRVRAEDSHDPADKLLKSILLETERLSPPIVGVMRRVDGEVILSDPNNQPSSLIPAGWDIWLYFSGAARDKATFPEPDIFIPERYLEPDLAKEGFAFGHGTKTCLGKPLVQQVVMTVAETILQSNIRLDGHVRAAGVRGWLGWESGVDAEAFARDLKQLPCQRPKSPIHVHVVRGQK
jgi:cytochrome P450